VGRLAHETYVKNGSNPIPELWAPPT
jgi:hypothetical protein